MEIDLLNQYVGFDRARGRDLSTFRNYLRFLEQMEKRIDNAEENEAYLCVGFGKSYFYNSVGILINDWDLDKEIDDDDLPVFRKFCKLFFLGKDGQKDFPYTRTVTNDGKGMGWIKVTSSA